MSGKHGSAQDRADAMALLLARPALGDLNEPDPLVRRLERWRGELRLGPLEDAAQQERTAHYQALADLIGPGRGKDPDRIAYLMVCGHGLASPRYRELLVEHWVTDHSELVDGWARGMGPLDAERYDVIRRAAVAAYDAGFDAEASDPSHKLFVAIIETVMSNLSQGILTEQSEVLVEDYLADSLSGAFGAAPADPELLTRAHGYEGEVTPEIAEIFSPATAPFPTIAGEIASLGDLRLLARIGQGIVPAARRMVETSTVSMTHGELAEACALVPPVILARFAVGIAPPAITVAFERSLRDRSS